MKYILAIFFSLLSANVLAQSSAEQTTPGALTTTSCPSGSVVCFKPYSTSNPLPVAVIGTSGATIGYVYTSNGPGVPATFQAPGTGIAANPPVITACGTSPSVDAHATNYSGTVTFGSGVLSSCTITFGTSFTTYDHCTIAAHTGSTVLSYSYTLSALTITGSNMGSLLADYRCDGQ